MELKDILGRFTNTWRNMTSGKTTGLIGFIIVIATLLVAYYLIFGKVTYVTLFNNLDVTNSGKIVKKLDESGVTDYKLANGGSTILVPEDKVDRLRINLAMDGALPSNGTGFEIFDSSGFAITDEDRKIMYQRALEGELQRTISSFEEVTFARVHLSLPKESVFSRDEQLGSASVILQLNPYEQLSNEQIRGVIALVSGAIKGIPEGNVRVVDSNANLLSEGLRENGTVSGIGGIEERFEMKKSFESEIESQLKTMLERTLGKGRVAVSVNAILNYDSEEATSIFYDKDNNVVRSLQERILVDSSANSIGGSPVDNNIQYYSATSAAGITGLNTFENIKNYEISETKTRVLKAPGELLRLTTSVVYDGNLDVAKKASIRNIVIGAVGYDDARNDLINIEGIEFDRTYEAEVAKEIEIQLAAIAKEEKQQGYIDLALKIVGGIFALVFFIIFMIGLKKKSERRAIADTNMINSMNGVNPAQQAMEPVAVDDVFESISLNLEREGVSQQKENEINAFVEKDPDRVAEIVKTWILKEEV